MLTFYFWEKGLRKLGARGKSPFLLKKVVKFSPQLLHSHFGTTAWLNLETVRRTSIKHIATFYGFDVNYVPIQDRRWIHRYKELFEQVDYILCEGNHMASCIEKLGCSSRKIRVHHLGVVVNDLEFRPRVWNKFEPLKILIAASFTEKKGIPYALEALGRFQHELPLQITIIGDASRDAESQAEKQKIMAIIAKHKLQSVVSLMGYQTYRNLISTAYDHHIFLSPSITASNGNTEGGAPVALIEMAATGMPIVSTTHCDIPEVVKHDLTGLLAAERDIEGLVAHLRWLVEHPDQWERMLVAGRQHVEEEYNAKVQGQRLARIYQKAVS
jgi:colanic acid/amylovoran biosynthesis glycosyltransferase